jgi:hypothetical protein
VQFETDRFVSEEQNAQAYSALVDIVGDCYIISHSQAGAYGIFSAPSTPTICDSTNWLTV